MTKAEQNPKTLKNRHLNEWLSSQVDEEITRLNVQSIAGDKAYYYLIPNISIASDRSQPDAQWRWARKRYPHIEAGGWWCQTINPVTLDLSSWGCFKPDKPRTDGNKLYKLIKYEHPPKQATELFCFDIPSHTWEAIAARYNKSIELPEIKQESWDDVPRGCGVEFWAWVIANADIPIIISEGAKKAGAILTAGYVGISLPGIFGGYRTPSEGNDQAARMRFLIDQLKVFAVPGRKFYFAFDQDKKHETRINVNNAITRTGELLLKNDCQVNVMEWQGAKGIDDLIAASGTSALDAAYTKALLIQQWKAVQLSKLTYFPDIQLDQRYIGSPVIPEAAKLIGIKSPKNTGKTEFLMGEVQKAHDKLERVLVLTHRIQLGEALCERFGLPYVTEIRNSETGDLLGYGLCVDSLHEKCTAQFNPNDWYNATVIIDEVEQVIWHMLSATTDVQKHRITVLRNFETLVQVVLGSPQGKIYVADADLSDIAISHIKSVAGFQIVPFLIENIYKMKAGIAHIYQDKDAGVMLAKLQTHIAAGGRVIIHTSGQKDKSRWGSKNLERWLKSKFPDLKILRIDAQSVADPKHAAYGVTSHLNEMLIEYDIVIASPTIETGVSIDIRGHFTSVWVIAQGVQPEDAVRQAVARLREPVERHIWAAPYGLRGCKIGNGATVPGLLVKGQDAQTRANIALLSAADCDDSLEIDTDFQRASLYTWAKRASVINYGMSRYREAIIDGLAADGYKIHMVEPGGGDDGGDGGKELTKEVTAVRDAAYEQVCSKVAEIPLPDEAELKAIKEKRNKTEEEHYQEKKADIGERYGVEVTAELVAKDDDGWYAQLRLLYYLTVGNLFLFGRDHARAKNLSTTGNGAVWKPDFTRGQLLPSVRLLEALGIHNLMNPDRKFKSSDADMLQMAALAKQHKYSIKEYLRVTISDDDYPIAIAQQLLGKVGLKLTFKGKEGGRGQQQRVYMFVPPENNQETIMQGWLERDTANNPVAAPGNKEIGDKPQTTTPPTTNNEAA